jgi:hypothetical protein
VHHIQENENLTSALIQTNQDHIITGSHQDPTRSEYKVHYHKVLVDEMRTSRSFSIAE